MANLSIKQVLTNLGKDILNWVKSNCVNNCVSTTTNLPLAAAQGKVLQDQITTLNSNIKIRKKDVALTTDGNGTAKTDLNADDFVLLQISLRENSYYKCEPMLNSSSGNTWWIAVTDLFGSVVANKLVNFTLYYQYISKD